MSMPKKPAKTELGEDVSAAERLFDRADSNETFFKSLMIRITQRNRKKPKEKQLDKEQRERAMLVGL